MSINWKKIGLFAGGTLFGTAGVKILSSKDAKKVYTGCTAAVLRAKDCVMKTATTIQENAGDIYAEAKDINEARAAKEEEFEIKKSKFQALIADEMVDGKRCLIMKPQTMMNLSGEAIMEAAEYYNIPNENIIVIYLSLIHI